MTAGSGGDVYPFLQLGRELVARGHRCTLITHCVYEEKASRNELDFIPLDTPVEYRAFIEDQPLLNTPRGIPQFLKRHTLSNVSSLFDRVERHVSRQDTVLLTRDLFDTAPRVICEKLDYRSYGCSRIQVRSRHRACAHGCFPPCWLRISKGCDRRSVLSRASLKTIGSRIRMSALVCGLSGFLLQNMAGHRIWCWLASCWRRQRRPTAFRPRSNPCLPSDHRLS